MHSGHAHLSPALRKRTLALGGRIGSGGDWKLSRLDGVNPMNGEAAVATGVSGSNRSCGWGATGGGGGKGVSTTNPQASYPPTAHPTRPLPTIPPDPFLFFPTLHRTRRTAVGVAAVDRPSTKCSCAGDGDSLRTNPAKMYSPVVGSGAPRVGFSPAHPQCIPGDEHVVGQRGERRRCVPQARCEWLCVQETGEEGETRNAG